MPFRRSSSTGVGENPPPYFNRWCWQPACFCDTTYVRLKRVSTFGGVKTCGLNIQSYDAAADPGYYEVITGTWSRKWKLNGTETVVETCDMEVTITMEGPPYVKSVGEACGGSSESVTDCDAPPVCASSPGCYYEDSVIEWSGSGSISEGTLAAGARTEQTVTDPGWGDWEKGWASVIGSASTAQDSRSMGNASFNEISWELDFGGIVREHKITWIETVQPLPTGSPTTSERSLHITGPGTYTLDLVASPNTRKTMGNIMLQFPIP